MHLKTTLLSALSLILISIPCHSQSWQEVKSRPTVYLYGEGVGATEAEADQQALRDLLSKISIEVSSDFSLTEEEALTNGELDAKSYTQSKIETYSAATLTNTERLTIDQTRDGIRVARFIRRDEIERIFEGRIHTIREYISLGIQAESQLKLDDALRYFYWSLVLLRTVQHPAEVGYSPAPDSAPVQLLSWLPEQLNSILSNIKPKVTSSDECFVDLQFSYKGQDITSLDFSYFDGRGWSNLTRVEDGFASMEFIQGMIPSTIQLKYEYAYRGQTHLNPEMKAVLTMLRGYVLRRASTTIRPFSRSPQAGQ